jgi:hypothetical protein
MSALCQKQTSTASFDYLVGPERQRLWKGQALLRATDPKIVPVATVSTEVGKIRISLGRGQPTDQLQLSRSPIADFLQIVRACRSLPVASATMANILPAIPDASHMCYLRVVDDCQDH